MPELAVSAILAGLLAPHLLPLERVSPARAGAVWLAALVLRAVLALSAAIVAFTRLPQTAAFDHLARTTWHALLGASPHIDIPGDPVAHALASTGGWRSDRSGTARRRACS